MEHGVVRKVLVCFFKEAEHVDQAPVERVAFAVRVDQDEDGGGPVDPIRLQVCVGLSCVSRVCSFLSTCFCLLTSTHEGILVVLRRVALDTSNRA